MKTTKSSPGSSPIKFVRRLQALIRPGKDGHRLSANVTGEEDWEVDEPQIRMSRAFAVMLVLHLVAVGGLFAFHMFGKDDRESEGASTRLAHETSPPPPAAAAAAAVGLAATPAPRAEVVEESPAGPAPHIFKAGETKMLVAAKFGVTVRELEDANPDSAFEAGDALTIPHHSRLVGALAENAAPANTPIALVAATPSEDVAQREFMLKKEQANPYAPVTPAELPRLNNDRTPHAKLVKAEPGPAAPTGEEEGAEPAEPSARGHKQPLPPPVAAAATAPTPKPKPATGSRTHVIQKGDTVYNVAKRYGLSPVEVMRANGITDPSRVQMGQVLKITNKR